MVCVKMVYIFYNYSAASAAAIRRVFDYDTESAIAARKAGACSVTD